MALCFYSFFCSSTGFLALVLHWDYIELRTEKKAMSSAKRAHNGNQWSFDVVFDNSCIIEKINEKSTSPSYQWVKINQHLNGQTNQGVGYKKIELRSMVLVQGLLEIRAKANIFRLWLTPIEFELTVRDVSQNDPSSMQSMLDLRLTSRDPRCCKIYGLQIKKGGFHLQLLVFPFVYQFNSRIWVIVHSSFAND